MRKIRFIILIVAAIAPLISKSQDYGELIQKIQNYQDSVKLKSTGEIDIIDSTTFDIHTYLTFFDNIKIEKGFNINVYYFDNFLDGNPYLYALKENKKIDTKKKKTLYKTFNEPDFRAKNHVFPNDNEIGFLQYLFFYEMGEQFALKWHSNYKEKFIISTQKRLDEVISEFKKYNQPQTEENEVEFSAFQVDLQELDKFAQISPTVEVEISNEFCTITWIEDRTHSGIFRCKYRIQRQFPFKIEKINEEQLLEITIGFIY